MSLSAEALKIAAGINKKLGANTVVLAGDAQLSQRITSGSLTLDVVLGGGWPMNRWVELVGEASHGKTAIALRTIAANQKINPDFTAVWIAAEDFDAKYAELCGVDNSRVLLVETNSMEDAFDAVIQFMESKAVDMVVVDSLPALVPSAEDEKHMEEFTVGRGALITNKFFSPRTTPGGLGKDYAYSVRCEVKRDDWLEVGTGESKRRVGQTIRVRTIKNKTFPPQQTAYLDFYFAEGGAIDAGGYDTGKEIVALSILNGIVERRGGWMYYGDRKWQGAQALIDSLREEIDLREELSKAVLSTIKAQPILALHEDSDEE